MHIAIFLPSLEGGGAERVMVNLAIGFVERGHRVDLVLADRRGPFLAMVPQEVNIVDLRAGRVVRALGPLTKYLRESKPAAIISSLDHANLVTLWAVRRSRQRVRAVVVVHTTMSRTISNPGAWTDRVLLPPLVRRFYRWADAIVTVSHGAGDDLRHFLGDRCGAVHVIPNPVVLPDLASRADGGEAHAWCIDGGTPVLLGVGRLWHQKNFGLLLRAFAAARLQSRARIVILGEGPLRHDLETLRDSLGLRDVVAMPGFSPNPYPSMRKAKVFVLSSVFEALPTVVIEALALGTPVIAVDCPTGPAEILENGKWGTLIPAGDVDALAEALSDAVNARAHATPVPEHVLRPYTLETAIDRYLELVAPSASARQ